MLGNKLKSVFACVVILACLGCDGQIRKRAMPAPLRDDVRTTLTGNTHRFWGGDNFEFGHQLELHYIILRGVDAPDPGQPFYHQAKREALVLTRRKTVDVNVVDRDEFMREIADVIVPVGKTKGDFTGKNFNLGVELIRRGWARHNPADFLPAESELARPYLDAESAARKLEIGIWQQPKIESSP